MSRKPLLALAALAVLCPLASAGTLDETKLLPSSPSVNTHEFGHSVCVSDDVIVVGASADACCGLGNRGSATVFRWDGTSWVEEQQLIVTVGADDDFGWAVAASNDVIVVGAPRDDIGTGHDQGSATVYRWDGNSWLQEQELTSPNGANDDRFGYSVCVSDDVIAVGADGDVFGAVTVFRWDGTGWVEEQQLTASDGEAGDDFGHSVSISTDVLAIGNPRDDIGSNNRQGSATVFRWDGTIWIEEQRLTASDGQALDSLGYSVSVDDNVIVAGAFRDDIGSNTDQGSAMVFRWDGTSWVEEQQLTASDGEAGDDFGHSVSVDDNVIVAGALGDDSATVFRWGGIGWIEELQLTASDSSGYKGFGFSVALCEERIAVGAPLDWVAPGELGSAYVYSLTTAAPTWADLGNGLAGTTGDPALDANGLLTNGSPLSIALSNARPFSPSTLVLGVTNISAPFKGGTLVPMPDFLLPFFSNGLGEVDFSTPWPAGVPSALTFYLQFWISDPAGPSGFAASNGLSGTTP